MSPDLLQLSDEVVLLIFEQVGWQTPASHQSSFIAGFPHLATIIIGPMPRIEEMLHNLKFLVVPNAFYYPTQPSAVATH